MHLQLSPEGALELEGPLIVEERALHRLRAPGGQSSKSFLIPLCGGHEAGAQGCSQACRGPEGAVDGGWREDL